MKKIFSILSLLLMGSTVATAQVKIADGIANGTVTSAVSGQTVTLTATPADGYYLESISAVRFVEAPAATRGGDEDSENIKVLGDYTLTKTSTSADRSQPATYQLTLDEGLGAYVTATFAARTAITSDQMTLSETYFTYNGSDQKPTVTLTGLTEGVDCTVTFDEEAWINAGTYSVTVTGIDTYQGFFNKLWIIAAKMVDTPTIELSQTSYTYNTEALEPTVTVMDGSVVIPTYEYTVTYENNIGPGTATVIISDKEGGNYIVSGSAHFDIVLPDSVIPKSK